MDHRVFGGVNLGKYFIGFTLGVFLRIVVPFILF